MFAELLYHLKRPFHLVKTGLLEALPAEVNAGYPAKKLKIICITGTDGKTTSSTLLYQVLKQAGKKVALLSTVAAYIGDEEIDTGFHVTTPDAAAIQKFMKRMVDESFEYLVLETTSHGIYQHRLWGIEPLLSGYTNITMEHLDYHVTHDLYVQAKAMLGKKTQQAVVVNADDEMSFVKLKKEFAHIRAQVIPYSLKDVLPKNVQKSIEDRFAQKYNHMNARLVYALAKQLQVADKDFISALKNFVGVPGRLQKVVEANGIEVIVDFAHTPNALDEVLTYLRQQLEERAKKTKKRGRLIAVYGAAGLRDWKKRPAMGRIGAELANFAILTAEDPRTENVWSIIRQMKSNLDVFHDKVLSIADRRDAIFYAITELAQPGDIVGIFGKGHERSMCFGTVEYPWSDIETAQEAMAARSSSASPNKSKKRK